MRELLLQLWKSYYPWGIVAIIVVIGLVRFLHYENKKLAKAKVESYNLEHKRTFWFSEAELQRDSKAEADSGKRYFIRKYVLVGSDKKAYTEIWYGDFNPLFRWKDATPVLCVDPNTRVFITYKQTPVLHMPN